jgi:protein-S-isoprenylcysteine O-methyltransferase Ste14
MTQQNAPPKGCPTQWPKACSMQSWQKMARRIRVPLGFITGALYVFEVASRPAHPAAIAWSLALVLPGLALRAAASGTVKKNRELTVTGPYAYTRNPLYLGSMLIAAGFAVALLSWPLALVLAAGFAIIYIPVIAGEEQFLRATFAGFDDYCRTVPRLAPRLIPRLTPAKAQIDQTVAHDVTPGSGTPSTGFSLALYLKHREYNAAIGAALLYLSLLYLRPALDLLFDRLR